jgi:hypothetical protein
MTVMSERPFAVRARGIAEEAAARLSSVPAFASLSIADSSRLRRACLERLQLITRAAWVAASDDGRNIWSLVTGLRAGDFESDAPLSRLVELVGHPRANQLARMMGEEPEVVCIEAVTRAIEKGYAQSRGR